MNINYDNIVPENYSEEVKAYYAFPDPESTRKFLNNEVWATKAEKDKINEDAQIKSGLIVFFTTVGVLSYNHLLFPAGKVIRDKMEAGFSRKRYWTKRLLPFLGLAIPICILRSSVRNETLYIQ